MTILSAEELTKRYGPKILFEGLEFRLARGDKTALVAPNGTGKSTLLKVLAGTETPDHGKVMTQNGIRSSLLEQEPALNDEMTIREYINRSGSDHAELVRRYQKAAEAQAEDFTLQTQKAFQDALAAMDAANAWDYEQRMRQILGKLDISDLDRSIATLSGGERKRVALAFALLDDPDLLLLDEPTNHLDLDMVEWLEQYLARSSMTLMMVTHDRYFLDRVCNHILEIDGGDLYHHKGNYQYYLQKKAEREEVEHSKQQKMTRHYKKELEWMQRGPKARTSKSKSRIDAFHQTEKQVMQQGEETQLQLQVDMPRLGDKIVEFQRVEKRFDQTPILENFSYVFQRGERIGIIGRNGTGKSTLLRLITGDETPDSGTIDRGTTLRFGHYEQKGLQTDPDKRVIDVVSERAEVIRLADGSTITASRFLEHFQFPAQLQYTKISSLSGGEYRRLTLLMVLIENPNFLILDEPTNDLDLETLQRLEEFLLTYEGCLVIVSHDRFFMDRLVDHYLVFEGDGAVQSFHGSYTEYRLKQREREEIRRSEASGGSAKGKKMETANDESDRRGTGTKEGLTWQEKQQFQKIEEEIRHLEEEQAVLEKELSGGGLTTDELNERSRRYGEIEDLIDRKSHEWLEMAERNER